MLCSPLSVCNTIFVPPVLSGNTYDRSIMVDEEEASIVLYDIWEQVSYILFMFVHLPWFLDITFGIGPCMMLMLVSVSFLKDNSQWLKEQCMRMGDAYIIVYSVTDKSSFEKASELRIQLRRARQSENIPIILVGNKSDLVRSREVSVDGKSVWLTNFWTSMCHRYMMCWADIYVLSSKEVGYEIWLPYKV